MNRAAIEELSSSHIQRAFLDRFDPSLNRDGMGWGTGAMLATGRRELTPQLLLSPECSQDGKIALQVDHWLVCMHDKQLLSIGHACPSVFHQRLGGTHAEQSADDTNIEHSDPQPITR